MTNKERAFALTAEICSKDTSDEDADKIAEDALNEAEARGRKAGLEEAYRQLLDACRKAMPGDVDIGFFNGLDDAANIVRRIMESTSTANEGEKL